MKMYSWILCMRSAMPWIFDQTNFELPYLLKL